MFLLARPAQNKIDDFLAGRENERFSYQEIGGTAGPPPPRYNIDHNRIKLGDGRKDFETAKSAVRNWKMFEFDWVSLFYTTTPIETGRTVAILIKHFGFYSLNAARIVYTIDETKEIERFGFAYGTLTEHGEIGEERFTVELHLNSGEVWYDLYAFSRPGSALARLGYPIGRRLQRAFAEDSKAAMLSAVRSARPE